MIKIVVIGAGSAAFGRGIIADITSCKEFNDLEVEAILVDIDRTALERMEKFSEILKKHYKSKVRFYSTTERKEALPDANYVITAVARERMKLWKEDFYTPFAFGVKHVFGENAGPGGAFHTLRSLNIMIPIAKDMEKFCPNALLINYTNPESRVCMGVKKLTSINIVGLCHGMFTTLYKVAEILEKKEDEIEITIGGINHFHWVMKIEDKNGKNLYPLFHEKIKKWEKKLPPLARKMYEIFGYFPFPSDDHIGEFLQFAYEICGPEWSRFELVHRQGIASETINKIRKTVDAQTLFEEELALPSHELAIPIICDIELDRNKKEPSVNIPNNGYAISNLPEDAIVEIPAIVNSNGLHPIHIGPLPEPIAAICRTQITIQKLLVEAYQRRSKKILLQALALDPITTDLNKIEELVDIMLEKESEFLPKLE